MRQVFHRHVREIKTAEAIVLLLMVFTLPLQSLFVIPYVGLTATKLGGVFLIFSVSARRILSGQFPVGSVGFDAAIAMFASACIISSAFSVDPERSFRAVAALFGYLLLFYAVADVAKSNHVQTAFPWAFVMAAGISGAMACLASQTTWITPTADVFVPQQQIRRIAFGLPDPNEQAMHYLFALSLLLIDTRFWASRWRRFCGALLSIAIVGGVGLTMSRTGQIGTILLGILRLSMIRQPKVLAISAFAIVVAIVATVFWDDVTAPLNRRIMAAVEMSDVAVSARFAQYVGTVDASMNRPILGYGLDTAKVLSSTFSYPGRYVIEVVPHSLPLLFLLELGLLGCLAYFWLWASISVRMYESFRCAASQASRRTILAYGAVFASFALVTLVMPFLYRSGFAILFGCIAGALHSAIETRKV